MEQPQSMLFLAYQHLEAGSNNASMCTYHGAVGNTIFVVLEEKTSCSTSLGKSYICPDQVYKDSPGVGDHACVHIAQYYSCSLSSRYD
jgi:hypothetical protein